ncbi:MAG: response regulator [Rhodospirillales bacterium]|nr:response regulator [Alphaproteobacteria bacterium]MCB9976630.1 response regulator [Rhodospirillales bacterium]
MIESILHAVNTKQVFIARNSDHALVVYKIHTHDLLIVDLDVNTIGGIELTKEIKKEKQNIPVILMASHMHFEAIRQAKEIGITDLLIKPFSFDDLMKHINFVMDGKKT